MKSLARTPGLFLITLLIFASSVYGQNEIINLTFTANYHGEHLPLDSILVQNLTQGLDTMLYAPDSVLQIDYSSNVNEHFTQEHKDFSISQNVPNPFSGMTTVSLFIAVMGQFDLVVSNIIGQRVAWFSGKLDAGTHLFTFYPGNDKFYVLSASCSGMIKSIKMISQGGSRSGNASLVYSGMEYAHPGSKSQTVNEGFIIASGDQLRYTGYATTPYNAVGSNEIEDSPQTNQAYSFNIIGGIRCPGAPTVTDIEGNVYNTVLIGSQCLMKENLKTTKYSNGTLIPHVTDSSDWQSLTSGAYVWYDNDISFKDKYGALYNWFTTIDSKGLCPTGWHVPTHDEWTALRNYLAGLGSSIAKKLKSCRQVDSPLGGDCNTSEHPRWNQHNTSFGSDDSGFSWLPGGTRSYLGGFYNIGKGGYKWSSSEISPDMAYSNDALLNDIWPISLPNKKQTGMMVRCLRNDKPKADFSGMPETGGVPLTVDFKNLSDNLATSWFWDFGDGNTSTEKNPSHTYNTVGSYTIQLTASNISGSDTETKTNYINVTYAPVAAFSVINSSGEVQLTVDFTDQSLNTPSSWHWDFGDDNTSSEQNPSHTYMEKGNYIVKLSAANIYGSDTAIKSITVHYSCPGMPTVTDIDGNVYNTLLIGSQCWMKENLRVGTMIIDSLEQTDNGIIEKYCYNNDPVNCEIYGGLYIWDEMMSYSLIPMVQGICPSGWHIPSDEEWKVLEGSVDSKYGVGDPIWDIGIGSRGFDVGKNLKSTSGWYQDGNSTDLYGFGALPGGYCNPGWGFEDKGYGTYWWSSSEIYVWYAWPRWLKYYSNGSHRKVLEKYYGISVRCLRDDPPDADFSAIPITGGVPLTASFTDLSTNLPTSWNWDFGDGNTSTEKNPAHTYNTVGSYTVQLTATNSYGSGTEIKTNYINVTYAPVAIFAAEPPGGAVPLTVDFTDLSLNTPTSWLWDFGDGNTSSQQHPSHTYVTAGHYFAKLMVTNSHGSDTAIKYLEVHVACPGTPTVTDIDGNVYNTLLIGDQCWLKENLNVGTMINGSLGQTDNDTIEKYCYGNDPANCAIYGGLYQWAEMMGYSVTPGAQGICPPGWHIPTDDEWKILEGTVDSLYGVGDPIWDNTGWRGYDAGKNLKSISGWNYEGNGADLYGFGALPGSRRQSYGGFYTLGSEGYWWTGSGSSGGAMYRRVFSNKDEIIRHSTNTQQGFSVRCIKDN